MLIGFHVLTCHHLQIATAAEATTSATSFELWIILFCFLFLLSFSVSLLCCFALFFINILHSFLFCHFLISQRFYGIIYLHLHICNTGAARDQLAINTILCFSVISLNVLLNDSLPSSLFLLWIDWIYRSKNLPGSGQRTAVIAIAYV